MTLKYAQASGSQGDLAQDTIDTDIPPSGVQTHVRHAAETHSQRQVATFLSFDARRSQRLGRRASDAVIAALSARRVHRAICPRAVLGDLRDADVAVRRVVLHRRRQDILLSPPRGALRSGTSGCDVRRRSTQRATHPAPRGQRTCPTAAVRRASWSAAWWRVCESAGGTRCVVRKQEPVRRERNATRREGSERPGAARPLVRPGRHHAQAG